MKENERGSRQIRSSEDLLEPFYEGCKPRSRFRIGAEMEKFGVSAADGTPMPYAGQAGILSVLRTLSAFDGVLVSEYADGPPIALRRGDEAITLEPGGQLELSARPLEDVHAVWKSFQQHLDELEPMSRRWGVRWLGIGFHPFARRSDFEWVPKLRYDVMRQYLPTRGDRGLDMMLRTATVQVNLDFESEADAIRRLQLSLKLAPVVGAMFANSPFYEGRRGGGLSERSAVWLNVDPDRTGLLPFMWTERARFTDYVEWALDAPMFMIKRGVRGLANAGQTFRAFMSDGFDGERATMEDWETHLNTLFPEVRLKRTLEMRSADAQSNALSMAVSALWTGLLYDDRAWAEAEQLAEDWRYDEVEELRRRGWRDGLNALFRGRLLRAVAERVVDIANGGLARRNRSGPAGLDERVHLRPLASLVERGITPAEQLLASLPEAAADGATRLLATLDLLNPARRGREADVSAFVALSARSASDV